MSQPLNAIKQIAYVVTDLDAAIEYWTKIMKVGPFFKFEHAPLENQMYRGNATDVDVTLALGNSGDLNVELIYQHNDVDSVYKEFLDAGRKGMHHFGLMPEDYKATCEQYRMLGYAEAFKCSMAGAELTYFDATDAVGHYIEVFENHDVFKGVFGHVEEAAKGWDGSDPVRPAPF